MKQYLKKGSTVLLAFLFLLNLVGCSSSNRILTDDDRRGAVELNLEEPKDVRSVARLIPFGVFISPKLSAAMREYSEDTVFRIGICFQAMVSESDYEEMTYIERYEYLEGIYDKASKCCIEEGMLTFFGGTVCQEYRFFYAYGTQEQIRNLPKYLSVQLYAFATVQYL